ncbi:hypothetical protein YC2023_014213 [Brassica napus]
MTLHVCGGPDHRGRQQKPPSRGDPSQEVAAGVFRISTAVNSFFRLVNSIGTPKDTLDLRDKLLVALLLFVNPRSKRQGYTRLKEASEADHHGAASPIKKIADAKLAKDFQSVLKEFQKAQRLAAEREITYTPVVTTKDIPTRQEVVFLDNEITFNEAIIEEREQGIREIQEQIGEVNEIFKDLAVLVNDQGVMIDDISSNIDNSQAATAQATAQLRKASKTQRANSSLTCLLILIFGIVLLIVIIVVLV